MRPRTQHLLAAAALAAAVAVLAGLWQRPGRAPLTEVPCADIVAGCRLPAAGLSVRFDRPASALTPFRLAVTLPGVEVVYARFSMNGMEMGPNRYRLLPDGSGGWQAEVVLPACIQGRSDWSLELETPQRRYRLPFRSQ